MRTFTYTTADEAHAEIYRLRDELKAANERAENAERERDGNRTFHEAFKASIFEALDKAGAPTHHPDIGAPARKPMMPQERITAIAENAKANAAVAGELIAAMRKNLVCGTFNGCYVNEIDEFLNKYAERIKL